MRLHEARNFCGANDGYLISLEKGFEKEFIMSVINELEQYSTLNSWTTGLYGHRYTSNYKWTSGQSSLNIRSNYSLPEKAEKYYALDKNGKFIGYSVPEESSFICEKSDSESCDFQTCFSYNRLAWSIFSPKMFFCYILL